MEFSATLGKQCMLGLITSAIVGLAGCSHNDKTEAIHSSAATDTQWYGGYTDRDGVRNTAPRHMDREPAPMPAPAPSGNCANYRPGLRADQGVTWLAFPTGDTRSSAVLVHQVMPKEVRAGANYDMEIHVTNITSGTLQNVVVNGESMENLNVVSSAPAAGKGSSGSAQWVLGDLKPCETRVLKVSAKADKVGTSSNCVSVTYNNVLCAATTVVQPALQLTKTITSEAMVCDEITGTYEVKNTGTGMAENVVIKDTLPGGLTTADGKNTVEINAGNLASGASARRTVMFKAAKSGSYESGASAMSTGGLTANAGAAKVMVKQPVLAINIKCPNRVFVGRDTTYEITVQNKGDTNATNVSLMTSTPSGATPVRMSDNGTASGWNLGSLPAGGTKTVSTVIRSNTMGANSITATAKAYCADAVSANCSTNLEGIPAILVECIDDNDPVEVGGQTTYTITVTNQGSAPGTGIKLAIDLPAEQDLVTTGGASAGTAAGRSVTFAPLATLAPKAKASWTVTIRANKAADVRFGINVTSDQFSNPIRETESTNQYQ